MNGRPVSASTTPSASPTSSSQLPARAVGRREARGRVSSSGQPRQPGGCASAIYFASFAVRFQSTTQLCSSLATVS